MASTTSNNTQLQTPAYFDLQQQIVSVRGLPREAVRMSVEVWLRTNFDSDYLVEFRVDTGADFSILPKSIATNLGWQLSNTLIPTNTASGTTFQSRMAMAREYRFRTMPGYSFLTDFAISDNLTSSFGLLAWRDLALDFQVKTMQLPRLGPGANTLLLPGIQRFTLRVDRMPSRIPCTQ